HPAPVEWGRTQLKPWGVLMAKEEGDARLVHELVEEGKRVGKAPWCAGGSAEANAALILSSQHGIWDQETMDETVARRKREGVR
ncbi:unnamed protein product, partial [marine sediment metagenome]